MQLPGRFSTCYAGDPAAAIDPQPSAVAIPAGHIYPAAAETPTPRPGGRRFPGNTGPGACAARLPPAPPPIGPGPDRHILTGPRE